MTFMQPKASLLAAGLISGDTRYWDTDYRGWMAIHAGRRLPLDIVLMCSKEPFRSSIREAGFGGTGDLPLGVVVGVGRLVNCFEIARGQSVPPGLQGASCDWREGRFCFVFQDLMLLPKEYKARGARNVWDWTVPREVFDMIRDRPWR